MKKRILIIISVIILFTCGFSVKGRDMGNIVGSVNVEWWCIDGCGFGVSTIFFDFGTRTYFGNGWDCIEYYYGEEDLPHLAKSNVEIVAKNEVISSDEKANVYVYEANTIGNQIPKHYKIAKGDVGNKVQNLNLNLEKGKLYIIVFCDEKGKVLDVKKIIL